MDNRTKALHYAEANHQNFLTDLKDFIRIPSISTDPSQQSGMENAASWVSERLKSIGMQSVTIFPTARHPVVYGEWLSPNPNVPTVLIYGHYDVQPADPVDLWISDPFEPTQRGENLYARGASDMKGQVSACIYAVESIMQNGQPPVNIKFVIEGEEEIGSPNLNSFMENHKDLLACDVALNPDTGMIAADTPTITYALRGLAYYEIRVYGPKHDLHSGLYGGIVHNPAQVLCELIAGMHDAEGQITLPGFYDDVRALTQEERTALSRLPMDNEYYLKQTGAPALYGEAGYTAIERVGARPTLDVSGFLSGFTGQGSKTIIPAWAMAKISMRLVPDQDPDRVRQQLDQYIRARAPHTVRWEMITFPSGPASISDIQHPAIQSLEKAFCSTWGKRPLFKREGGSVPVVANMQRLLGIESVLTGFGLADDNIHAPNEKLHLPTWYKGISAFIHFFYNYGETHTG